MAKKTTDEIDNFFAHGLDVGHRTLYLGSSAYSEDGGETGVDFSMAEKLIKGLHVLEAVAPGEDKPITIIMNNPGGDVIHGLSIYNAIKRCKNHVTIEVFGYVTSMGAYILQAADTRKLAHDSVFMFHEGMDSYSSQHPKIIDRWRDFYKEKLNPRLDSLLLDAINIKRAKDGDKLMTLKEFEKHNIFDTLLTAQEAVEWGFADGIIDGTA